MIGVRAVNGSLAFDGASPTGAIAYVDADWFPRVGGAAAALVVSGDGTVAWSGRPDGVARAEVAPDAAAGLVLDALASAAAAAAREVPRQRVVVLGHGLVARWVRARLGAGDAGLDASDGTPPQVVVDTTADAETALSATRTVEDLGTVVLAGGVSGRTISLDFYPDVHVRGLRIVGAAPALEDALARAAEDADRLAAAVREAHCPVRAGEPVPGGAQLYRLEA